MRNRILRIVIVLGLSIILIQIWLLPENEPYLDFYILSSNGIDYEITGQVEINGNESIIYPFVRNVMNKVLLVRIQVYGINQLISNETKQIETLSILPRSTWAIQADEPASNINFESKWKITPLIILGISHWVEYLNVTLQYYDNMWIDYAWLSLGLI